MVQYKYLCIYQDKVDETINSWAALGWTVQSFGRNHNAQVVDILMVRPK